MKLFSICNYFQHINIFICNNKYVYILYVCIHIYVILFYIWEYGRSGRSGQIDEGGKNYLREYTCTRVPVFIFQPSHLIYLYLSRPVLLIYTRNNHSKYIEPSHLIYFGSNVRVYIKSRCEGKTTLDQM